MTNGAEKDLEVRWLGTVDYEEALILQKDTVESVKKNGGGVLLACEHPTVITLGKRGQPLTDILTSMETLRLRKIKIVATERGGQATLHNPGQLVIYPILDLREWELGVKQYVEALERATAVFLAEYGVEVFRGFEPGLFSNDHKIAAFGIRVDRGVTSHGLAININNDLEPFSLIKQCGLASRPTNLYQEMATFGFEKTDWDLRVETEKWKGLFLNEVRLNQSLTETSSPEVPQDLI
jgi:lipoate-protein ligase B